MKWLIPPFLLLFCLITILLLWFFIPVYQIVPDPFRYLGIGIILGGFILLFNASNRFKKVQTNIHTFKNPDILVTQGPFSFSRNPMYLGFTLLLLGAALLANVIAAFLVVIFFFVISNLWYIPFEEQAAAEKFGNEYDSYRKRVRRWI
ncbi:MAG: isoprenylcysteine carboxylmethyltransferase family protein [Sneathiella sp.]